MPLINLQVLFYYGRASCRDILFAGISADKASSGMAGVVVGVRVYGRILGVLTTGKISSNTTGTTRGPYDIPRIPH